MTAILFGSIGAVADTSELQRAAFNEAFARHGLDWSWDRDEYRELLRDSGGRKRVADYAAQRGEEVDADAVHATKSEIFQAKLREGSVQARPGVVETIEAAERDGTPVALVTTTSPENIAALGEALRPAIDLDTFALVTDTSDGAAAKPSPEIYPLALERLGESSDEVVAVEDNVGGVAAAIAAGIPCVAFPGENNAEHDFADAATVVTALDYDELRSLVGSR